MFQFRALEQTLTEPRVEYVSVSDITHDHLLHFVYNYQIWLDDSIKFIKRKLFLTFSDVSTGIFVCTDDMLRCLQ